ncbi:hypothetical protein LTR84_012378 [Exophiala bonariae]|uniref:rRNA methyltransferase 2, mitochondrial n=1 Tax=Exophiala bonariae TaxID=1690606 RepID=A0AAV9NJP2_9EURO|nr:hypothetical protein LTR84_012378 [Exophiala bonariae]
MDSELAYMTSTEIAQSMKTAHLELAYERALRQAERIYEEERVRAIRVSLLLLEDENEELQEQALQYEDQHNFMEETNEELRDQVAIVETDLEQTQMDLKARLRDLDHLRAEVNALNAASADATKLLSEKLALARELNILKPELEHLKSHTSTQQKLLSEKLALEREVSSLQVELDTEKRTVHRIKAQEKSSASDEATITAEIEELKKELARAKREAQKTDRENRKKTAEWEGQKDHLEEKLEAYKSKLRGMKDQLSEAQSEIERLQAAKMAQSTEMTKMRLNGGAAANPRKRNVAHFDPDMTIGTPGNGGPAAKKQRFSVNPGDKSTFSMTPFLNRTLSSLPESPTAEENEPQKKKQRQKAGKGQTDTAAEDATEALPKAKTARSVPEKPSATKKPGQKKTQSAQPLKETTNAKANTTMKKPQLEKLMEESSDVDSDQEKDETDGNTENVTESTTQHTSEATTKAERLFPKRTNIFDEEDGASAPKVRNLGGGPGALGRLNLKAKPNGKAKVLAEFSPLKKDRRAMDSVLGKDQFARAAKVQGLKSRAAFKLLQINDKYRLFKPGMTVIDLGFAPGSWSQVAIDLTKPRGRVLGVDLIPVQPPKGVSAIQGNFLSPDVQAEIKSFLRDPDKGRLRQSHPIFEVGSENPSPTNSDLATAVDQMKIEEEETGYLERQHSLGTAVEEEGDQEKQDEAAAQHLDKTVDVVLSDMWEPWDPLDGMYKKTISNPYRRLMNTSGNAFRDHAGSMDLCRSALYFSYDTLKVGGHFVCKFYQGAEDKALEKSLKAMFQKVHRDKPESSRSESKEAYFVGIKRLAKVDRDAVFSEG